MLWGIRKVLSSQIVSNICEIIIAFFTAFMALGIWYAKNSLEEQRSLQLSAEELVNLKMVLITCNRISMFVLDKLIDDKKLISLIGVSMLNIWEKIELYIEEERGRNSQHYGLEFLATIHWLLKKENIES